MNQHIVFDTEIIGKEKPVFLVCTKCVETGERTAYWHHKRGHMKRLIAHLLRSSIELPDSSQLEPLPLRSR